MADTSESEASRCSIEGLNLSTDSSGLVEHVGSLENTSLALLDELKETILPWLSQSLPSSPRITMDSTIAQSYIKTDTSASKASPSHRWIKEQNVFELPDNVLDYRGPLEDLTRAFHIKNLGEHKAVQLTFTQVPAYDDSEPQMALFLYLLMNSRVSALDISLRRYTPASWFRRYGFDRNQGPRWFVHIKKLYIRFPEEPEVSLEDVNRIFKESLTPDNRFPCLEELRISGLNEKEARNAQDDPSIGLKLFVLLIDGPNMLQLVEETGRSIGYRVTVATHREDGQDAPNELFSPASGSGSDWLKFTKSK